MQKDPLSVSFIGLGAMGLPMATRLSLSGARLTVFDTNAAVLGRAQNLGDVAPSLQAAITSADVIFTMLPADPHVLEVGSEIVQRGHAGQVYVDLSTVHPATMESLQADAPAGLEVVSASCMKAVAAAVAGDLTLFVGGAPEPLDRVRPLLDVMASRVLDVGDIAAPKTLKIINNMIVAGLNLAIAEAIIIAQRAGIEARELLQSLAADEIGGWPLHNQVLKHSVTGDFPTGLFGVRYMAKDVALGSRLCDDYSVNRFLCGPIAATFRGAASIGLGNHYHPVILQWLDHSSRPHGGGGPASTQRADEVLSTLKASTRAMEQLTCIHGLHLASRTGLSIAESARSIGAASAASSTMAAFADGTLTALAPAVEAATDPVAAALTTAAGLDIPVFGLEAAHDFIRTGGVQG